MTTYCGNLKFTLMSIFANKQKVVNKESTSEIVAVSLSLSHAHTQATKYISSRIHIIAFQEIFNS